MNPEFFKGLDNDRTSADLGAGMSVAAVAIPIGLAYAQLAGAPRWLVGADSRPAAVDAAGGKTQ